MPIRRNSRSLRWRGANSGGGIPLQKISQDSDRGEAILRSQSAARQAGRSLSHPHHLFEGFPREQGPDQAGVKSVTGTGGIPNLHVEGGRMPAFRRRRDPGPADPTGCDR